MKEIIKGEIKSSKVYFRNIEEQEFKFLSKLVRKIKKIKKSSK